MPSILVVAFIVSCGHQLLLCEEIDTQNLVFVDMGNCETKLDEMLSVYQKQVGPMRTVLGRCRYLLNETGKQKRNMFRYTVVAEQAF